MLNCLNAVVSITHIFSGCESSLARSLFSITHVFSGLDSSMTNTAFRFHGFFRKNKVLRSGVKQPIKPRFETKSEKRVQINKGGFGLVAVKSTPPSRVQPLKMRTKMPKDWTPDVPTVPTVPTSIISVSDSDTDDELDPPPREVTPILPEHNHTDEEGAANTPVATEVCFALLCFALLALPSHTEHLSQPFDPLSLHGFATRLQDVAVVPATPTASRRPIPPTASPPPAKRARRMTPSLDDDTAAATVASPRVLSVL